MNRLLLALMIVSFVLLPVGIAHAQEPACVSGTFAQDEPAEYTSDQTVNGDRTLVGMIHHTISAGPDGGIAGSYTGEGTIVIYADGIITDEAQRTFDGKLIMGDKEYVGTLLFREVGTGIPGSPFGGHWSVLSGTGELANVRGQGTWVNFGDGTGEYTLCLEFVAEATVPESLPQTGGTTVATYVWIIALGGLAAVGGLSLRFGRR